MTLDELVLPRLRRTTDVSGLVGMSGGRCTHSTRGPGIRLKYKKVTVISRRLPAGNVLIFPQTLVGAGYRKVRVM